jgi:hypothetical protein
MVSEKMKKHIKDVIFWSGAVVTIYVAVVGVKKFEQRAIIANAVRRDVICPSLLSVGRSARDTLIVMKAEPLCNTFVLDSLK